MSKEVNVHPRKRNYKPQYPDRGLGLAQQDQPVSNPEQHKINLRRPSGQNSGKVKSNIVRTKEKGLLLQDVK